jgi:hypothetical protein
VSVTVGRSGPETAGADQYARTATHLADHAVAQLPGHFRAKP